MNLTKKIILLVTGPGAIAVIGIALFVHLFTEADGMNWIIGALVVFFVVFIPIYVVENFKYNDQKMKRSNPGIQFSEKNKRIEWEGGNIHGKTPKEADKRKFMEK